MKKETKYCPECNDYHFFIFKNKMETYTVKNKQITVKVTLSICDNCKKEIGDDKLDDITLNKVYDEYARLYGENIRRIL
jgi:uncharacterized protein with PIN domain